MEQAGVEWSMYNNQMHITITTVGSRGDVQPFIALALGLKIRGHQVRLVTSTIFEEIVSAYGLEFAGINVDPRQMLQDDVRKLGSNPKRITEWIAKYFNPMAHQYFTELYAACQETQAILFSSLAFAGYHVAEKLGVPSIATHLQPMNPTRAFPPPNSGRQPVWLEKTGALGGWYNYLSFRAGTLGFMMMVVPTVNRCRQDVLGLPAKSWSFYSHLDFDDRLVLYGFSQHVIPKPADWKANIHIPGYWFLDRPAGWNPPDDLRRFLDSGPAPVYIGFGSMVDFNADEATRMVSNALKSCGQRGVLLGGWSDLGSHGGLPAEILRVEDVPHEWLFPKMSAIVHHGGAGTTASALRAGVPQVVIPYFADQPFWGRQMQKLGVAPNPLPRQQLTQQRLTEAIQIAASNRSMKARAVSLGEIIRQEDGVNKTVELIEQILS